MLTKSFSRYGSMQSMVYNATTAQLKVTFLVNHPEKRGTKMLQERTYEQVPTELAHKWYYTTTLGEAMSFFAKNIRKKFKVSAVKEIK